MRLEAGRRELAFVLREADRLRTAPDELGGFRDAPGLAQGLDALRGEDIIPERVQDVVRPLVEELQVLESDGL